MSLVWCNDMVGEDVIRDAESVRRGGREAYGHHALFDLPASEALDEEAVTIRLLEGDVRAMLATLEPESVQCVVTSPPYWGLRNYGVEGQIGLEPTPQAFVETMVNVFRAVKRVLRPDGVLFVNLGDSYAGSNGNGYKQSMHATNAASGGGENFDLRKTTGRVDVGLKPKDLVGIPWRVALALQDDGWYWRSTIVWAKRSCMPESVTDRPTNAWEPILQFSRSRTYFWDADAVREEGVEPDRQRSDRIGGANGHTVRHSEGGIMGASQSRNQRNVWDLRGEPASDFWLLGPEPFPGAHFATFPTEIPRRCILAATSEKGQCPQCGAPWVRVVEKDETLAESRRGTASYQSRGLEAGNGFASATPGYTSQITTTGWRATCTCPEAEPVPQAVLDPFAGSGTTGLVADRLGRNAVLIELNPTYAMMIERRIVDDAPLFTEVERHD